MKKTLLDIRLKYKFWLLNTVSFSIVCLMVLASVWVNHSYLLEEKRKEGAELLTNAEATHLNLEYSSFIAFVKSNNKLALQRIDTNDYLLGSEISNYLSDAELKSVFESVESNFTLSWGMLSDRTLISVSKTKLNNGDIVISIATSPSVYQLFKAQMLSYSVVVLVLMLFLLVCSQFLITFFERHINHLKSVMLHVRNEGDLTSRVEIDCHDEVGEMALAFNEMQDNYQETVRVLISVASELHHSASSLQDNANRTEIDVANQHQETELILESIEQLSEAAQEVASSASEMQQVSESAAELTASGESEVQGAKQITLTLNQEIEQVSGLITTLQEDTKRIDVTTDEIQVISEQTNLLALNAAIEAARAGESGRGFAVVADEVRSLAQHAHDSSQKIQDLVDAIRSVTGDIIRVMEQGKATAHNSVESSELTVKLFSEIGELTNRINDSNLVVASATEEQSQTSYSVCQSLESVKLSTDKVRENTVCVSEDSKRIAVLATKLENTVSKLKA